MEKALFYKEYPVIESLKEYSCRDVNQLENKLVYELRKYYKTEVITISEKEDIVLIKVEDRIF